MARLFGTDGVRGLANADLTPELALSVAAAAAPGAGRARQLAPPGRGRRPGPAGQRRDAAGRGRRGPDLGGRRRACRSACCRRPAVAHLVGELGADLGVMISASHNPMPDNGIKLFAAGGHKLPDAIEDEIEAPIGAPVHPPDRCRRRPGLRHRRRAGPLHRAPAQGHPAPAGRPAGRGRLRERRRVGRRAAGLPRGGRRGDRDPRAARRREHQRRLRLDPSRRAARGGARREAPTWASRTTATPTAASPWTRAGDAGRRRPDHGGARAGHAGRPASWSRTPWSPP